MKKIIPYIILLLFTHYIALCIGYYAFETKVNEIMYNKWNNEPRPVKYIDTCASYQPKK